MFDLVIIVCWIVVGHVQCDVNVKAKYETPAQCAQAAALWREEKENGKQLIKTYVSTTCEKEKK